MLGAIKNIKMLGVQEAVSDHILEMREEEIEAAKSVRWMMIAYNASGKLPRWPLTSGIRGMLTCLAQRTHSACLHQS